MRLAQKSMSGLPYLLQDGLLFLLGYEVRNVKRRRRKLRDPYVFKGSG